MRFFALSTLLFLLFNLASFTSTAQVTTNTQLHKQASIQQGEKEKKEYEQLKKLAREKGWKLVINGKNGYKSILAGIDSLGMPLYLSTNNNILAAATIGTNRLWPGGSTGLNLDGSSDNVKGKLAIWDGGNILSTHVELTGRILQKDNDVVSEHSTHVAGTLMASGVNPLAKGMSFGLKQLVAYNFTGDLSEMMGEAPNLLLSNHSYGYNAGWVFNEEESRWEFWGRQGANEDFKFGYYSAETQIWDSIAYNAPLYLIVKSAGNSRDVNGPAVGQPYFRFNASNVMASAGNRPAGISNNDGYDILSTTSTAKNILAIGAVNPIGNGYTKPGDVVLAEFSSWGPTDDGRIKPDVVADGVNLLSSVSASNTSYATFSGTSMSSPNAAGSLLLLQEYYSKLHSGAFMRAATLKGLAIHTADEAGPAPGPDYQFGWGLLNIAKAAAVIKANNTTDLIQEGTLANTGTVSIPVIASGNGSLSATISWTDPKGQVEPVATALNNSTKKLVNDLDIVIKKGAVTYRPWILSPGSPSVAATTGDNTLDNVEKVEVSDVVPGDSYTIQITHKGTLERGSQAYSLLASGVGGVAYCASGATSTAGAKIDSVSFANIQNKNIAGCTSYTSYTNLVANVEPSKTIPFFMRLTSCDASTADKVARIYIDVNNDGDFTDAGENIGTSSVINGNGDYATSVTIPAGLIPGKYTLLRIVMEETSTPAAVLPCGSYTKGETQDYRVLIATAGNDLGISELISPEVGNCASGQQRVTVRIQNFGNTAKSNVPVNVVVKQGAATVATLTGTFPGTVPGNSDVVYTLQTPFVSIAGTTYTITSSTTLPGDQNAANDQNVTTISIPASSTDPAGTAVICGTDHATLTVAPVSNDIYTWYNAAGATVPIAVGPTVTTPTILPTYYLGKNDNKLNIGPATKDVFPSGNYAEFQNRFMLFNNSVPLTIESVRLYIGNSNAARKLNFILGRNFSFDATSGSITFIPEGTATLDIYPTDPTPQAGTQNNDPTDPGAVFYLNLPVETTGEHMLLLNNPNDNDLVSIFRNNNITTSPYPVGIPGIFTFTSNSASFGTGTLPDDFQKFYYFFYDLKLRLAACPSPNRTVITATNALAPVISLNGNIFTSTTATGNQWYLNGAPINGATGQTFTAVYTGVYKVQSADANGCPLFSNEVNFQATPVTNVDPSEIGLTVFPNPATSGQFTLQLETRTRGDLSISLLNTVGQRVYQSTLTGFTGRLNKQIITGKIASGVYYLQVLQDNKIYVKKIVVLD